MSEILPVVLAFDTAGPICSAALLCQSGCHVLRSDAERRHARELLPMISRLMQIEEVGWSGIDALAIVQGPGSFTGLRIGSAVAQGLAFGNALPVVTVSSLRLLADKALAQVNAEFVYVCVEARVDEYYFGLYRVTDDGLLLSGREAVGDCGALLEVINQGDIASGKIVGTGDAFNSPLLRDLARDHDFVAVLPDISTDAVDLAHVAGRMFVKGEWLSAEAVMPVYLKEDMSYRRSDE